MLFLHYVAAAAKLTCDEVASRIMAAGRDRPAFLPVQVVNRHLTKNDSQNIRTWLFQKNSA
jgi:hypothetical protein